MLHFSDWGWNYGLKLEKLVVKLQSSTVECVLKRREITTEKIQQRLWYCSRIRCILFEKESLSSSECVLDKHMAATPPYRYGHQDVTLNNGTGNWTEWSPILFEIICAISKWNKQEDYEGNISSLSPLSESKDDMLDTSALQVLWG